MSGRVLALLGLRCVGKSTLGRELAGQQGWAFVDLDEVLAEQEGRPDAGSLLAEVGEPAFRDAEARALESVLGEAHARSEPTVLATGGGVVERPANRARLAGCACVWLEAPVALLQERLRSDGPLARPSLGSRGDPSAELPGLLDRRAPWYGELAHVRLEVGALDVPSAVARLASEAAPLLR